MPMTGLERGVSLRKVRPGCTSSTGRRSGRIGGFSRRFLCSENVPKIGSRVFHRSSVRSRTGRIPVLFPGGAPGAAAVTVRGGWRNYFRVIDNSLSSWFSLTRRMFTRHPDPRGPEQRVRLRLAASHHITCGSSAYCFQISTMRCSPAGIRKTAVPCRATTDLAC